MTTATDTVTNFMDKMENLNFDAAATYLADNFTCSGLTPRPLNKSHFIQLMKGLAEGMPNLSFHCNNVHEVEGRLTGSVEQATIQITGRQSDGFILPPLGLPPIPQTDASVSLPSEHWNFTVQGDKIVKVAVEQMPGGGIVGLLKQLGVDIPIYQ